MADYGLAALSGLLNGLGGLPAGMVQREKFDQTQQQLDEQRRQFDEGRFTDLSTIAPLLKAGGMDVSALPAGKVPNTILPALLSMQAKRADLAEKDRAAQELSRQVREMGTTTTMAPGASLSMAQPGDLMTPPPTTPMPPISQQTVDPGMERLAKMIPGLLRTDPAGATAMLKDTFAAEKPQLVNENTTGVYTRSRGYQPFNQGGAPEPFNPPPNYTPTYTVDKRGKVTTTYKSDKADLSQSVADILQSQGIDPRAATPQQIEAAREKSVQDQIRIFGAKNTIANESRPLGEGDKAAIAAQNNILTATMQFRNFKPEEITAYVGLLNRPLAEAKQALAATFGVGKVDERFAEFKALMGRLQGTAFGEAGKQLTGIELAVVQQYTPTGREPGGAPEIMAKIQNLEAFTKIARATRIKMAQTGKGDLNPDEFDRILVTEMKKAGLPIPGQINDIQEAPAAIEDAARKLNQTRKSFKDWQREQQRVRP